MILRNMLQLLFNPSALEKESIAKDSDTKPETIKEIIRSKREGLVSTFLWILIPSALGIFAAQLLNRMNFIPVDFIPWLRMIAVSVFAFATLSRLSDTQSGDGNTLPEKTNKFLFKILYSLGFFLTIATLFLKTLC